MAKVDLDKIVLGVGGITEKIYAGTLNKQGNMWLQKTDVTSSFLDCVVKKWEGHTDTIEDGESQWEVTVKRLR